MKSNRPRSVVPAIDGHTDKFEGVKSSKVDYMDSIRERLDKNDEDFNDFDPTNVGFEVRPCFSYVQLKIIDERVSSKKSKGGLIVIEANDKLPYVWAEVLAAGPKAGIDSLNSGDHRYETFNKGDVVMCLEKNIAFVYLDDKPHSEYFEHDRPYIATIPDNRIILRKVK